jgi:hypothetical protein
MDQDKLVVLWTTGDRETTLEMVFMYTYNAKKYGWWDNISLIIWGASSTLAAQDAEVREKLGEMKEIGIDVKACKACADDLGTTKALSDMGIEVKYMGQPLTDYLKSGARVLSI